MNLLSKALKRLGYRVLGKEETNALLKEWETQAKQIDVIHQDNKRP